MIKFRKAQSDENGVLFIQDRFIDLSFMLLPVIALDIRDFLTFTLDISFASQYKYWDSLTNTEILYTVDQPLKYTKFNDLIDLFDHYDFTNANKQFTGLTPSTTYYYLEFT